jgi:HSP20 family protein
MENKVMNLQKLNPWNWFKHEESQNMAESTIPVRKADYSSKILNRHPMFQLQREIDNLFDQTFRSFGFEPLVSGGLDKNLQSSFPSLFNPDLNISSDDQEYVITLEAAGLDEKDISIDLTGTRLTVKGNKHDEAESKEKNFYRIERRYGSFQRVLALPEDAQPDRIKASMKNGLLTIIVPRTETVSNNTRKIEIEKA